MKEIYLDYSSATPLDPRVKRAMEPYWQKEFGNPAAIHQKGRAAKEAVTAARRSIARILGSRPSEIVFTAGATEADNIAIFGAAGALGSKKGHFITTTIEHQAVLKPFEALEREGHSVTYLEADSQGLVDPRQLEKAIRPETVLVSIGYANNEIGTVQPMVEVGKAIKKFRGEKRKLSAGSQQPAANEKGLLFHCDASQAAGFLDLNVEKLGVDLATINSSKIYGPKGSGILFVRRTVSLKSIFYGGGQERGLRSGTENVPAIVGLAKALETAEAGRVKESARLVKLRDYFIGRLLGEIRGAVLNGHPVKRLPNNVNISIPGLEGEAAVIYLDTEGIRAATGSACESISLEPSHVITALGKSEELIGGSLRFTLGRNSGKADIDYVMKILPKIIEKLGAKSGVGAKTVKKKPPQSQS